MKNFLVSAIYALLIKPFLKLIIGVKFHNNGVLNQQKQFIIAANHNSHLDALSLMAALPYGQFKNVHSVVAADYFGQNVLCKFLVKCFFNAIFIERNRETGAPSAIEKLDALLQEGKSLILFPEGSRGRPGVMTDFKNGVAVLLKRNPEIPFVPVHLNGFGRVLPKDSYLLLPLNCKVRFGEFIYPNSTEISQILAEVKVAILDLKPPFEANFNQFQIS